MPGRLAAYAERLSGPVVDRIDLQVEVERLKKGEIFGEATEEPTETVRERVVNAREIQAERLASFGITTNADIPPPALEDACMLTSRAKREIEHGVETSGISARGVHRVMRVGRTIADIEGTRRVEPHQIAEAMNFRVLDKKR
jgi:magnesium chelatase family protein